MKPLILSTALAALIAPYHVSAETLKVVVERAEAGPDMLTNEPIVTITLKPESKAAFGEFTKARVGEQVKLRLGETILSEPAIRQPIMGGTLVINGQFTSDSARDLAEAIMKGDATFEVDGSDK